MPRTSRAQNPAVVMIQQFARMLLAILERNRLYFARLRLRLRRQRLDQPPRAGRNVRQRYERYADRDEFHGPNLAGSFLRFPGRGDLYWRNDNMVNRGWGPDPRRNGEWNFVQFRPNGRGLFQEDGFIPASVDPEAGYYEHEVRFGNPLVYSSWHR